MHINLVNTQGTENVSNSIIEKLYNYCYGGDDPEDNEPIIDNNSNIIGNLNCNILYKYKYDSLVSDFKSLFINYNDLYLYIKDPYVKRVLLENNFGDNFGVYLSIAQTTTSIPNLGGYYDQGQRKYITNEEIVSFDELQYFRNVTSLKSTFMATGPQFQSVDLRNITSLDNAFYCSGIHHCKNAGNVTQLIGQCFENATYLEEFDLSSVKKITWQSLISTKLSEIHFGGFSDIVLEGSSVKYNKYAEVIDGLENLTTLDSSHSTYVFQNCESVKVFNMPNVTGSIPNGLFQSCYKLETVNMQHASGEIGEYAFENCKNLINLNIDTEAFTKINKNAFKICESIETIDFPNVTTIGENVFNGCKSLTSVNLPKLTEISPYLFASCQMLETINLPGINTDTIGRNAFNGCTKLKTVTGISSIKNFGDWAFGDDNLLESIGNVKPLSIGHSAFRNCLKLENIDLSECTNMGEYALMNCQMITTADLSNLKTVTSNDQFHGCSNLESVTYSTDMTVINGGMFRDCPKLTSITNVENVVEVKQAAFFNSDIRSISLPNVEVIGNSGFCLCKNLSSISIPKIRVLGSQCFASTNLTSINASDFKNVERWEWQPFNMQNSGHNNLIHCEKIVFNKLQYIDREAFLGFADEMEAIILNVEAMPTTSNNSVNPFSNVPSAQIYINDDIWSTVSNCSYYSFIQNRIHKLSTYNGEY